MAALIIIGRWCTHAIKRHWQSIYRHSLVVRITHWVNVICLLALLMSGLQIFNAHPALYWGSISRYLVMLTREVKSGRRLLDRAADACKSIEGMDNELGILRYVPVTQGTKSWATGGARRHPGVCLPAVIKLPDVLYTTCCTCSR